VAPTVALIDSLSRLHLRYSTKLVFGTPPRPPTPTLFPYTTLFRSGAPSALTAAFGAFFATPTYTPQVLGMLVAGTAGLVAVAFQDGTTTRVTASHVVTSYVYACLPTPTRPFFCEYTVPSPMYGPPP